MKQFEYLYFAIYTHYSKRSYFPDHPAVRLQAMFLLSISAGGWILFAQATYLRLVRNAWFSSSMMAMMFALCVYTTMALIFHRVLIVEEGDQKIINKYAAAWSRNRNKKRDLLFAAFVMILPYILLVSLKVFFPRPH